jgi:uncharacterized protein (TIGR02145 family)
MKTKTLAKALLLGAVTANAAPADTLPAPDTGRFVDLRDKHSYGTVKIGHQTWMAENLALWTMGSSCPGGEDRNCQTYGRLYAWQEAVGLCPEGWHLPTKDDWERLLATLDDGCPGTRLRSAKAWDGTDEFGFGFLPTGARNPDGTWDGKDSSGYLWSATEDEEPSAFLYGTITGGESLMGIPFSKRGQAGVRCLRNPPVGPPAPEVARAVVRGTMTDRRDHHRYRTVKIGHQTWMAENLDYRVGNSWCYEDNPENCRRYGRLYDWKAARHACPGGWHLPADDEWDTLALTAGGEDADEIGKHLKAGSGWETPGADPYGFAALPAGGRNETGLYQYAVDNGLFWTSTESSVHDAWGRYLPEDQDDLASNEGPKELGMSVRCVQDSH